MKTNDVIYNTDIYLTIDNIIDDIIDNSNGNANANTNGLFFTSDTIYSFMHTHANAMRNRRRVSMDDPMAKRAPLLCPRDLAFYETIMMDYPTFRFPKRIFTVQPSRMDAELIQKYILQDRRHFAHWRRGQILRAESLRKKREKRRMDLHFEDIVHTLNNEYEEVQVAFWKEAPIMLPYQKRLWEQFHFPEFYKKHAISYELLFSIFYECHQGIDESQKDDRQNDDRQMDDRQKDDRQSDDRQSDESQSISYLHFPWDKLLFCPEFLLFPKTF